MSERTLRLTFENALDTTKEVHMNIPKADDTKSGSVVKVAMNAIRDNYDVFTVNIGAVKKAAFVTPTVYNFVDIS